MALTSLPLVVLTESRSALFVLLCAHFTTSSRDFSAVNMQGACGISKIIDGDMTECMRRAAQNAVGIRSSGSKPYGRRKGRCGKVTAEAEWQCPLRKETRASAQLRSNGRRRGGSL